MLLSTSIHKGSSENIDYSISLQPELKSSTTTLRFNLDPFHILSIRDFNSPTIRDYLSYTTAFIDEIRYRSFNEVASITLSKDVIIPGDAFGITSAITSSFKSKDKNLGFLHTFKSKVYSHTISFSDLSFIDESGRELVSYDGSVTLPSYPLSFGAALLLDTSNSLKDFDSSAYYPELYLKAPIYFTDDVTLSLQVTAAMRFLQNSSGKPDGWGLAVAFPLSLERFTFNTGVAFTAGKLQYGTYLNGYITERSNSDTVLFFARALYENAYFSAVSELQLPVDVETITMVSGEEFGSFELSTKLFGLSLGGGFRSRGIFSDIKDAFYTKSESFISMGYSNEAISTKLSLYFGKELKPEVALTATMSGRKALSPSLPSSETTLPEFLSIELFTGYVKRSDAGLNLMPVITFGGDETYLGLRFPFYLSTTGDKLITTESDPWYNFGVGKESTTELVYDAFTDIFTLIDKVKIGSLTSPVFFIAERNSARDEGMFSSFTSYASEDVLSLATGFNISGTANATFYVDDLEMPKIFSFMLDVYPMQEGKGPKLTLENSAEIRISKDEYKVTLPLAAYFGFSLFDDHFDIKLLAGTYFDFGTNYFKEHLFSMKSLEAFYGIRSEVSFNSFLFKAEGGMRKGSARSIYFDPFYFAFISDTHLLSDEYASSDSFLPYGRVNFNYLGTFFSIKTAYSSDDLKSLIKGSDTSDRFSLETSFTKNDLTASFAYHRKALVNSVKNISTYSGIKDYLINEDTLFSLSIEKSYEHLTFSASLYSAPESKESESYLNIRGKAATKIGFSLMTSVRF